MRSFALATLILATALALANAPAARAAARGDYGELMDQVHAGFLSATIYDMQNYGTRFCTSDNAWGVVQDLKGRMQDLGWETGLQEFTFDHDSLGTVTSWNVVSRRAGTAPNATIILCAHWDSVDESPGGSYDDPNAPAPGANDNGSGVAALLEIARILKDYQFIQNLEIVFFGAEEVGLKGSAAYVAQHNALGTNIGGVFNVDSIGYDDDELWDFSIVSDHQSTWFMNNVHTWTNGYSPELTPINWQLPGGWSNSDAYSFWQNNPPDPAVSIWEGRWDMPEEHAPYGNHRLDTYANCISGNGIFLRSMTRNILACLCEWAIIGSEATDAPPSESGGGRLAISPNPFTQRASIYLARGSAALTELSIYDLQGRRVRGLQISGANPATWDGRDDRGRRLAAGVYFVRADGHPELRSERVVLVR